MADILIRGLSEETVNRLAAEARESGLSRNEYLRRKLEQGTEATGTQTVSAADWARLAEDLADLSDDSVMNQAWR